MRSFSLPSRPMWRTPSPCWCEGRTMKLAYHHVGSENSKRDFPATIGTPSSGLKEFNAQSLEAMSNFINCDQRSDFSSFIRASRNAKFQIWGIPAGAQRVFDKMEVDDLWMLLDSPVEGGGMQYIGKVDFKLPERQYDFSRKLWTEDRFPYIFLMHGFLIHFPWFEFLDLFGYKRGLDPRGHVCGISQNTLDRAGFKQSSDFIDYVSQRYRLPAH